MMALWACERRGLFSWSFAMGKQVQQEQLLHWDINTYHPLVSNRIMRSHVPALVDMDDA